MEYITYREVAEMLANGQIVDFIVPPNLGSTPQEVIMTFILQDGRSLRSFVRYDPNANAIFAPETGPYLQQNPSDAMINWSKTNQLLTDEIDYLPLVTQEFVGKVTPEMRQYNLQPSYDQLKTFSLRRYRKFCPVIEGIVTLQGAFVREWSFDDQTRIQVWVTSEDTHNYEDESWGIIFASPTTFLIVGNRKFTPFMYTPEWTYDRIKQQISESYSFEQLFDHINLLSANLETIKNAMQGFINGVIFKK